MMLLARWQMKALIAVICMPMFAVQASDAAPDVPSPPKIAVFGLQGAIQERAPEATFGWDDASHRTLQELLERFDKAAADKDVKAVVLTFDAPMIGWAQMQELRARVKAVREAGKDVHCYIEEAGHGVYQLATAGTRICMAPAGELRLMGLYTESPYIKGLLDKVGVEADIMHMGAYKGAGEPLTRTGPSDEAREMLDWLMDDLYAQMVETIADGRKMSAQQVRDLIDRGPYNAVEAMEAQLIDEIIDADDFVETLRQRHGNNIKLVRDYAVDEGPTVDFTSPWAFFKVIGETMKKTKSKDKGGIAVVYIDGMIVMGQTEPGLFGDSGQVGSTDVRRMLARVREDDTIHAVVIRVDSPGGSALASDIMWRAVRELADAKPVAISMGNVAASGGYYLAVGASTIFADPATVTGSIGVVGGKIVTKGLWDWAGVSFYEVKRGAQADVMNTNRKFDETQRALMNKQLKYVYEMFTNRVKRGRGDRLTKDLDQIAGGRVYTGRQALKHGLVDQLGGLQDAVAFVADKAGLDTYKVRRLPESRHFLDLIMEEMTGASDEEEGGGVGVQVGRTATQWLFQRSEVNTCLQALYEADPVRARAVVRTLLRVVLLQRESVLAVMPHEIVIR